MSHEHVHMSPETKDKRVAVAIWANGILTIAQIAGGIFAGSLALIADAIHNFSDMASLVLIYEGTMRFIEPTEIKGWWVIWLGIVALAVDALTALLTYSMQKGSVNIRALFLHNLSDAFASIAVVVGGALILLYDMRWVDPAITIGIASYILYLGLTEIGGTIRTLMLGSPVDIDTDSVIEAVSNVEGVIDLHHVHFWQMGEHDASLDAHVVVEISAWNELEKVKDGIKRTLENQFSITHSTLEFEHPDHSHKNAHTYGHG